MSATGSSDRDLDTLRHNLKKPDRRPKSPNVLVWVLALGLEMIGLFLSNITLAGGSYVPILVIAQCSFAVCALIVIWQCVAHGGWGRWLLAALAIAVSAIFFVDNLRRLCFSWR
jgi:hypothetical protein